MGHSLPLCLGALLFLIGVEKSYQQDPLFVHGPDVEKALNFVENNVELKLTSPFSYFGIRLSKLYLNIKGFLSTQPIKIDVYINIDKDIIAPLWTGLKMYDRGNISYEQATSGPLLEQATEEMNKVFPGFKASWVLVCTWAKMGFEPDTGEVTFQVVLIADNFSRIFVLMNYGSIPNNFQSWNAGYRTEEQSHNFQIPVSSITDLSKTSNIGIPGRWAFQVEAPNGVIFPVLDSTVHKIVPFDGGNVKIPLDLPFLYFGRVYSQVFLSMDGFLSFDNLSFDTFPNWTDINKDIIAPLWPDIDVYSGGSISYVQETSGSLLDIATREIKKMFPDLVFTTSWVFIATWNDVEFKPNTWGMTFQVVLICDDGVNCLVLMNYGSIPRGPENWMAGCQTEENTNSFRIQTPSLSDLTTNTNVKKPGRWAFHVNGVVYNDCGDLNCSVNEVCSVKSGISGCGCVPNNSKNSPDNFDATETCAGSSGSISLSRCQLFEAGFSVESLHLNDPNCKGTVEDGRVKFHFDQHNCGTNVLQNDTHFAYENSVQMSSDNGPKSVVSRGSWLNINFSCVYPLAQSITVPVTIQTTGSVVSKSLETTGTYQIIMTPYLDESFTTPTTGNMEVQVNNQVYVSVDVIGFDSSEIATVLDSCWATPNENIDYPLRWNLITNECPDSRDGTVQVLQNGNTTTSRFSFKMFTFTGHPDIFLHCQVHLCLVQRGDCAKSCMDDVPDPLRKRRSLDFHDTASITMGF